MPDISVALGLLKKPIESLISTAAGRVKDELVRLKAEAQIKTIYQKLNYTQKVKTIWDVDRARSLSSFYYPAKIKTSAGTKQQLSNLDELPSNAVVLSGTVGQGKSILLRYLLGKEMRSGNRLPLFVELRKVSLNGLEAYLQKIFGELLETAFHSELFKLFAEAGKISFLLDGFDEIDPDRAQDLMSSIERLVTQFPNARVVVTSRPASGIETSALFDIIHIAPLSDSDFPGFFNKILSRERELAEMISSAVLSSASVKAVASTPLLATLLTIVYRSTQRIPADFSEFYEELFQILLVRHDRSKAYTRKRKTNQVLGDREMQQAFEAFCYKAHADGRSEISKIKALEISKSAIAARELICREDDFIEDVIRVTCLLQEEGSNVEFVHQSVREFYAAKYVASRPEEIAAKFYETLGVNGNWKKWDQVISFLSHLDKYRASRYYLIPTAHKFLKSIHSDVTVAAPPRLRTLMSDLGGVMRNPNKKAGDKQAEFLIYRNYPKDVDKWYIFGTKIYQLFFSLNGIGNGWRTAFDAANSQFKTFTEIAIHVGRINELDKFLIEFVKDLRAELSDLEFSATVIDSSDDFMGL
jgi:hypothetical protein